MTLEVWLIFSGAITGVIRFIECNTPDHESYVSKQVISQSVPPKAGPTLVPLHPARLAQVGGELSN